MLKKGKSICLLAFAMGISMLVSWGFYPSPLMLADSFNLSFS